MPAWAIRNRSDQFIRLLRSARAYKIEDNKQVTVAMTFPLPSTFEARCNGLASRIHGEAVGCFDLAVSRSGEEHGAGQNEVWNSS